MRRFRILNLEPSRYSPQARATLGEVAEIDEIPMGREELLRRIKDYDVVIVRLGHRIDAELVAAAPRLRAIATATTGLDHVDLEAAARQGVAVLSLRGDTAFLDGISATAELAWGLLLALVRRIPAAHADVLDGAWKRDRFWGNELRGKQLGIVGLGRLGVQVARFGAAFGMTVRAYTRLRHPDAADIVCVDSLPALLATSDAVSLHVPLDATTERMFDSTAFAAMKRGSVLVNTSRGAIVDEEALLAALESGRLGGAALDVLGGEADFPSPGAARLVAYAAANANLVLTPHIGGATVESLAKVECRIADKIRHHLQSLGTER